MAFPGVRFVVRRQSPKSLLGGGFVEGLAESITIAPGYERLEESALALLRECGLDPIEAADAAARINARAEDTREAFEALVRRDDADRRRSAGRVRERRRRASDAGASARASRSSRTRPSRGRSA